jgi:hypothetical protein
MPAPHDGVRLHRFSVDEYRRMAEKGVLDEDEPIELIDGLITVQMDHGPPYGVPLGIPPGILLNDERKSWPARRFSVEEYEGMIEAEVFAPELRHEMVEGWVVDMMTRGSRHDSALQRLVAVLMGRIGEAWTLRVQSALTLDDSVPEPDLAVVSGPVGRFDHSHPRPHEVALVVEIADATLEYDRTLKLRTYARNYVAVYWIVKLIDNRLEVYEDPSGPTDQPEYRRRKVFGRGESAPIVLREETTGTVAIDDLLPAG